MSRVTDIFSDNPMTLIVSLPANDVELAKAAAAGGADMLKTHIHLRHQASGTGFGNLEQEEEALRAILAAVELPVGLVVGAEEMADEAELERIEKMGFAYIDAYAHHLPGWMMARAALPRMVAVEEGYVDLLPHLAELGMDMIEAAVIPHQGYGQALNFRDLGLYRRIAALTSLPVVVPTQRAIRPDEVAVLRNTGVVSLMIGAIVTGRTPEGIEKATGDFRRFIDRL